MRLLYVLFVSTLITSSVFAQFQGSVPPISSGYGSDGSFSVSHIDITNDYYILKKISIFYPSGTLAPVPTIFYAHGYGSTDTTYHIENLKHIASQGYAVVFVPYKSIGVTNAERYETLYEGFAKAARTLPSIIDTTRVGFFGQSFGGGATPRISYRAFTENNWGSNGRFIYCSAPWYSFELGSTDLSNFPTDCNMLTVLYDDDLTNDHRMGMDIFNNIAIHDSIKDCLVVHSDTISGYVYAANHYLPSQYTPNGSFDALDYYVTFRLLDALADFTFTGNLTAKNVALGNGSPSQIDMGGLLTDLSVSNTPSPIYPESKYVYPCTDTTNERQAFCQTITNITSQSIPRKSIEIYPNPVHNIVKLRTEYNYTSINISIISATGKTVLTSKNESTINVNHLTKGIYFLIINIDGVSETKKIIKL